MRMNTPAPTSVPAVVLVNLGTPDAPTPKAVRRYLAEFLHDHRVVALTRWLWCPILHFVILPFRSPRVAKLYAGVWMDGGSPLAVHTARLTEAVQREMPEARVVHAMRYGHPSLRTVLEQLRDAGHPQVQVLPLYPQYSTTTTASVGDIVDAVFGADGRARMRADYHVDPAWVEAVAASIRAHWAVHGRGERLLFSFHGIPQRLADAGDPYPQQCRAGADAIVRALGLLKVDTYSLPNVLAGRPVVPELIQEDCTAERLSAAVLRFLQDPAAAAALAPRFAEIHRSLRRDASARAADVIETLIDRR